MDWNWNQECIIPSSEENNLILVLNVWLYDTVTLLRDNQRIIRKQL